MTKLTSTYQIISHVNHLLQEWKYHDGPGVADRLYGKLEPSQVHVEVRVVVLTAPPSDDRLNHVHHRAHRHVVRPDRFPAKFIEGGEKRLKPWKRIKNTAVEAFAKLPLVRPTRSDRIT